MAWAKNGTPTTLGSPADDIDIIDLTEKKFHSFLFHRINSGEAQSRVTFNNDGDSEYNQRYESNGGSLTTLTSQTYLSNWNDATYDEFMIIYMVDIDNEEKLGIYNLSQQKAAGASNVPARTKGVFKFTDVTPQVTRIDINNGSTGDFAADSNLSAIGTD